MHHWLNRNAWWAWSANMAEQCFPSNITSRRGPYFHLLSSCEDHFLAQQSKLPFPRDLVPRMRCIAVVLFEAVVAGVSCLLRCGQVLHAWDMNGSRSRPQATTLTLIETLRRLPRKYGAKLNISNAHSIKSRHQQAALSMTAMRHHLPLA